MKAEIQALQQEIFEKQKELAALRLQQEPEQIDNYLFKNSNNEEVSLLELFGNKDELLIIHNMGKSCVYCTMWADVLSGMNSIIQDRVKMVLTSPDEVEVMQAFTASRNWQFDALSYHGTSFSLDLGFAYDKEGKRWYQPGVSGLIRKDNQIYRTAYDFFGPGDVYCAPWHLFELFPKGADNWQPKYKY